MSSSAFLNCVHKFFSVFLILTILSSLVVSEDSLAWNLLRKQSANNFLSKTTAANGNLQTINNVSEVNNATSVESLKTDSESADTGTGSDKLRQYGQSTSYYGGGGGGYDIYTLIAVSAFAALFGALFFELIAGGSFRSMDSATVQLPMGITFESEQLPQQIVAKITDWISNTAWLEKIAAAGSKSRTLRDVSGKIGVTKWIQAYKKDPIEYQCVRKVACETLAESSLVARSMKSPFGGFVLKTVGSFMDNGHELQSIVRNTIGNPDRCRNMAPWGFCEDDDDLEETN